MGTVDRCELESLTVEHLRGFESATLPLNRGNTVLVGPNNSGKTSLLRLLEWVFNGADEALLSGERELTDTEADLLLPARETRGGARRVTLRARLFDGRRARGFQAAGGVASMRLQLRGRNVFAALGPPRRGDGPESDPKALKLLELLKRNVAFTYVPSARDAESRLFDDTLRSALELRLQEKLVHREQGGAPAEYRTSKKALDSIEEIAQNQVRELWKGIEDSLPEGLVQDAVVEFAAGPDQLTRWLSESATLKVSTGSHDRRRVRPSELGSGTQSLLLLALLQSSAGKGNAVLLEEPEAFLHPSAQRALARSVFDNKDLRTVIATHSPVVVDEAVAADVLLVRDHKIFAPRDVDTRRRQINSALLTGQGSEAIFSKSVLLVEGPGDRAFFERLRRRLGGFLPVSKLSDLGIVAVGGKAGFGPWVQLLESYADRYTGERPISWLAIGDGIDASADLARGLREGGLSIEASLDRRLKDIAAAAAAGDQGACIRRTQQFNNSARSRKFAAALVPIDLEYSALSAASDATISAVLAALGLPATVTRDELLAKLGSKAGAGPSAHAMKHDWVRAEIANLLPWSEVSGDVKHVLRRWITPVLDGSKLPEPLRTPPRRRRRPRASMSGRVTA